MSRIVQLLVIILFLFACNETQQKQNTNKKEISDKIYQYSLLTALANKIYDGDLTVAEVKEKGDLGLGTYNGLNGEMIVLDGEVFQFLADGTLLKPNDSELVPFTVVTFFDNDTELEINESTNYEKFKSFIEKNMYLKNVGCAFKVEGNFTTLTCGSAPEQTKPYSKTLSEALVNRPIFEYKDISGTLVGFWFPEYIGKVNVAGFHLHFISDNKKFAGHVIDFKTSDIKVAIDYCDGFEIELPQTDEFEKGDFDLLQQYK